MPQIRNSNFELFRIVVMLVIVAHHYVVNSGLTTVIWENYPSAKSLFLILFGWGGKTGINCFVLITGYFMCTSQISLRKFLKLFLEVEFYKFLFFIVFASNGYAAISLKFIVKSLLPIVSLKDGFVSCYLVFFCFIPFLNILIKGLTKRQHQLLLGLCLLVFSFFPTILIKVSFSYVSWFMVVYLIGSYLRLYPPQWSLDKNRVSLGLGGCLALSLISVWGGGTNVQFCGEESQLFFGFGCQ